MTDPSRSRAAAEFDLPASAEPDAVRAAFLKRLPAHDYAPPEEWNAAAVRLGVPRLALTPDALEAEGESENRDLAEFTAQYWSLAPGERRERWLELNARCRDGEVRQTLSRLQEGLAVVVTEHRDRALDELAAFSRALFLLPPRDAGLRRMEWCAEREETRTLPSLGQHLQQDDPATAALVPQLVKDMVEGNRISRRVPEMTRQQREQIEADEQKRALKERLRALDREQTSTPEPANGGWGWGHWGGLLFVVSLAIRGIVALSGLHKSPPPQQPVYMPSQPRYTIPTGTMQPWGDEIRAAPRFPKTFTPEQIRSFEESEAEAGKPKPPGYSEWKLQVLKAQVFTPEQIRRFEAYDPESGAPEPLNYRLWRRVEGMDELPPSRTPATRPTRPR